jgi:hypothetical protein
MQARCLKSLQLQKQAGAIQPVAFGSPCVQDHFTAPLLLLGSPTSQQPSAIIDRQNETGFGQIDEEDMDVLDDDHIYYAMAAHA